MHRPHMASGEASSPWMSSMDLALEICLRISRKLRGSEGFSGWPSHQPMAALAGRFPSEILHARRIVEASRKLRGSPAQRGNFHANFCMRLSLIHI